MSLNSAIIIMVNYMIGLYVHIPFCKQKCGYCDFYSIKYDEDTAKKYCGEIKKRITEFDTKFDTVYFGGGTPSIIGDGVADILSAVNFSENAEITAECNPDSATDLFLQTAVESGVNRLSIGLQSANDDELALLTRPHTADDVKSAVEKARFYGIGNISLDVMIGFHGQTVESLKRTLDFGIGLNVNHISAYLLKVEPQTKFSNIDDISLNDDEMSMLYEFCCEYLENHGYRQYEISNFAKSGFECRHNLIYWNCADYIGLGPAAHSLYKNKRYHFNRDLTAFLSGDEWICDGVGGDFQEYIMLRLRLADGLRFDELRNRNITLDDTFMKKCELLQKNGLATIDNNSIKLTRKGLLVQNQVLGFLM